MLGGAGQYYMKGDSLEGDNSFLVTKSRHLHMLAFLRGAEGASPLPSPRCLSDLQTRRQLLSRLIFPRMLCTEPGPCTRSPMLCLQLSVYDWRLRSYSKLP